MRLPGVLLRFCSVGALATLIHYIAGAAGLIAGLPPLMANLLGFTCAFAAGFIGHHRYTFRQGALPVRRPLFRYATVSLGGFAAGQVLLSVLSAVPDLPALAAFLPALAFSAAVNFTLGRLWVFT
ncbi:GtrA family protein [Leisingera sp. ANG-Vp]|uniref:GtrA family protein n=1 Tax=Leisingera sp. ANG-Vp TaxID=1577896 RepID=UPI00068F3FFB|nr:GtrA family protein [Leisingera sp. ANG-Vp]